MEANLYLYVDKSVPELYELYQKHIESHNHHIDTAEFPNSGFDLFVPESQTIIHNPLTSYFLDFKIKTEMKIKTDDDEYFSTAFQIYPRSSLSKTPLILSNHVGIIDCGYRGNIKSAFRCLNVDQFYVQKFTRLIQICHPSLCKIRVILVENEHDLSSTERGDGGFGSTGK
jgi:dUTP pyrophosphatase